MRVIPIAAASAVALLAVSAFAQQSPPSPGGSTALPRSNAPVAAAKVPALNPLKQEDVSKIEGTSVLGSDGKKIGEISTVLMKPDDRTIDRLVVRAGGLLGLGAHYVAMPIDAFSWDGDAASFKVFKSADDLKSMVEWTEPGSATTATGSSTPAEEKSSMPAEEKTPATREGR